MDVVRRAWSPPTGPGSRFAWAEEPSDPGRIVPTGENLVADGRTVLVNVPLAKGRDMARWLRDALRPVTFDGTASNANEFRLSGFNNAHRTFGVSAPQPLRRRYGCSKCGFDRDYPVAANVLGALAGCVFDQWVEVAPDEARIHQQIVEAQIRPDWRFPAAPWTSGIVNRTAALPYHRDSGNLRGSWSAMLVVRNRVRGGLLHVPEFDVWIECSDLAVVIFDGQGAWHGVTPMGVRPGGERFTVVWYAKDGIRKCGPAHDEPARAAREATR